MKWVNYTHLLIGFAAVSLIAATAAGGMDDPAYPTAATPVQPIPPPADWLNTTPVRGEPELMFYLNQFMYRCNVCHVAVDTPAHECDKHLEIPATFHLPFGAHQDMIFNHGYNLRCFNCHNCANLETYVNYDGSEIPNSQPVMLCRKCHGTMYRDWVAGSHGRVNGAWDESHGLQVRLTCNQCHNPHAPHFPRLIPRPPPSTLRIPHFTGGSHHE